MKDTYDDGAGQGFAGPRNAGDAGVLHAISLCAYLQMRLRMHTDALSSGQKASRTAAEIDR